MRKPKKRQVAVEEGVGLPPQQICHLSQPSYLESSFGGKGDEEKFYPKEQWRHL